jgi:SAM-dependent methyltransferase
MAIYTAESRQRFQGRLTPEEFKHDYSSYYETETSDSPSVGRAFLAHMLLEDMCSQLHRQIEAGVPMQEISISVLNVGSGRQILEQELQNEPLYQKIKPYIIYITGDIADIHSDQLLAPDVAQHVQFDGSQLPLANESIDIAFSCMAIDFMPREAFQEAHRVLKAGGTFMAALHHPDLIDIAMASASTLRKKYRTITQKLKHGKGSRKYEQYLNEKRDIERQLQDSLFLLQNFPHHIFYSTEEIYDHFATVFDTEAFSISVSEHSNRSDDFQVVGEQINLPDIGPNHTENGWYFVKVEAKQV